MSIYYPKPLTTTEKIERFAARLEAEKVAEHNRRGYASSPPRVRVVPRRKYVCSERNDAPA